MAKLDKALVALCDVVFALAIPAEIFVPGSVSDRTSSNHVALAIGAAFVLALALATGVGAWRRDVGLSSAAVCALVFPVTWVVWFVADNHAAGRRAFSPR